MSALIEMTSCWVNTNLKAAKVAPERRLEIYDEIEGALAKASGSDLCGQILAHAGDWLRVE